MYFTEICDIDKRIWLKFAKLIKYLIEICYINMYVIEICDMFEICDIYNVFDGNVRY